jgi:hypothetical protein
MEFPRMFWVDRREICSGSEYYNYKQDFSIVLLAMVDDKYCFRSVDIGAPGRHSDGDIFNQCSLKKKIDSNGLNIPEDFVMIGDSNFSFENLFDETLPKKKCKQRKQDLLVQLQT